MSVIAKFTCTNIRLTDHWDKSRGQIAEITLSPVYDSDPESENGKFFAATPSGAIQLNTVNPGAYEQFTKGEQYFVTFEPATVPA